jgi:hypothetical protein
MAESIDWNSFVSNGGGTILRPVTRLGGAPSGEDEIFLDEEPGLVDSGFVEIGLGTEAAITWWKGLQAWTAEGNDIGMVAMQDANHGPTFLRIPTALLPGARLQLMKAKVFGVHTGMYELQLGDIASHDATRFTFTWMRD